MEKLSRSWDEVQNAILPSKKGVQNIQNSLHDLKQHTFLKIHFESPLNRFGQGSFYRFCPGPGNRNGTRNRPAVKGSLTKNLKMLKGHLTDVWIEVSLSEPMILLDEKLKEAHQEKIRLNSLKTIDFQVTVKRKNSLRMDSHHRVTDHRPVVGPIRSGPWKSGSNAFKYCSELIHCVFLSVQYKHDQIIRNIWA